MLNKLKRIISGEKGLVCLILVMIIITVSIPRCVYYLSVQEHNKRMGVEYRMTEANLLRDSGKYRKAVYAYRNIAKKYPEKAPAALYEITRTYELSGSRDFKKIKAYQEVIQKFPDSKEAEKSLEGLMKLSNNSILLCQDLIRKYPDKYIGGVALATMWNNVLKQQNKEEAQKICLKWLVEYPVAKVQADAYKHLILYAQQSNNIQPVTDFSYRIIDNFSQIKLAESVTLFLAGVNFQKENYSESLCLWSGLEKKKKMVADKTQPDTFSKQPEVRKAITYKKTDIYQRIENLAKAGKSSPGYIKELARRFLISGEVCAILANYNEKDYAGSFFADETEALLRDQSDLNEKPGVSGFSAEEMSLRQEIIRITDGKVVIAYQKLAPSISNEKIKNDFVRYLSAYILVTRSASQVAAEMDIFIDGISIDSFLPVLLGLAVETKGYQYGLNICQEIINRSLKSADVAIVLANSGNLYQQMKMNADAIKIYKKIVFGYPEYSGAIKAQEKIIDIYAANWQFYPNAVDECFELTRNFPKSAEAIHAQFKAGKFYYLAGKYDQSIIALRNFVSKYPKAELAPETYLLLALNYLGKQENTIAVEQLRMLISKYPKHELASRAQFLIGYFFLSQQKYDDARREYQKLITDYPKNFYSGNTEELLRRLDIEIN